MKRPALTMGPTQDRADQLIERLWRARVAINVERREAAKRLRRPRAVDLDSTLPIFLRRQAF